MLAIQGVSAGVKDAKRAGREAAPRKLLVISKKASNLPPIVSTQNARKGAAKKSQSSKGQQSATLLLPPPTLFPIPAQSRSLTEEAEYQLSLPPSGGDDCGTLKIRYNHYQKLFPVHNGVVKWKDIDEEYAFSFVFKGQYTRDLVYVRANPTNPKLYSIVTDAPPSTDGEEPVSKKALQDASGKYFLRMSTKDEFLAVVHEDPSRGVGVDGLTLRSQPLLASELHKSNQTSCPGKATSAAVALLTEELKGLSVEQLGGEVARDLIERRDLEDILFSPT